VKLLVPLAASFPAKAFCGTQRRSPLRHSIPRRSPRPTGRPDRNSLLRRLPFGSAPDRNDWKEVMPPHPCVPATKSSARLSGPAVASRNSRKATWPAGGFGCMVALRRRARCKAGEEQLCEQFSDLTYTPRTKFSAGSPSRLLQRVLWWTKRSSCGYLRPDPAGTAPLVCAGHYHLLALASRKSAGTKSGHRRARWPRPHGPEVRPRARARTPCCFHHSPNKTADAKRRGADEVGERNTRELQKHPARPVHSGLLLRRPRCPLLPEPAQTRRPPMPCAPRSPSRSRFQCAWSAATAFPARRLAGIATQECWTSCAKHGHHGGP